MTVETAFAELLTEIRNGQLDTLRILERCLRFCRTHKSVLVRAERERGVERLSHAAREGFTSRLLQPDAKHSSMLGNRAAGDLANACEALMQFNSQMIGDRTRCIVVRKLAEALDATHHARIATAWTNLGPRELKPGDLVPIFSPFSAPDFRRRYGAVGTPPFKLDRSVDATPNAVLVPDEIPHAARLFVQPAWHGLDPLSPATRVVCCFPSGADLIAHQQDLEEKRFFGAAPQAPELQLEAAFRLVKRADAEGAGIVVLPELCLDSHGVETVAAWVAKDAENISLALCGSHHTTKDGTRSNVAVIASSLAPTVRQAKLVGMEWKPQGCAHELREDIEAVGTPLLLLTGQSWSALVLICRDFIDRELGTFASALRASLILVPACSPRTVDFQAAAGRFASHAQAHVVVANKCDDGPEEPDVALLARPVSICNEALIRISSRDVELPQKAGTALNRGPWVLDV